MPSHDRYAHLRENLTVHREMHAASTSILWCQACGYHHADESGLCPVCRPSQLTEQLTEQFTGQVADETAA